jgi:hypothetical protein
MPPCRPRKAELDIALVEFPAPARAELYDPGSLQPIISADQFVYPVPVDADRQAKFPAGSGIGP